MFKAVEEGTKKEEEGLIKKLRRQYGIPRYKKVSKYLAAYVPDSEVFVKIIDYLLPFSQMLKEIYQFLDEHRSSIFGNADQFTFNFETLSKRVPFGLGSFPKMHVDILSSRLIEYLSFDPTATGKLLEDRPDYWRDGVSALQNMGSHIAVQEIVDILQDSPGYSEAEQFVTKHISSIEKLVNNAKIIIKYCEAVLIPDEIPFHFRQFRHFSRDQYEKSNIYYYYRNQEDRSLWRKLISDYEENNRETHIVYLKEKEWREEMRQFDLTELHKLVEAWKEYQPRVQKRDKRKLPYSDEPVLPDTNDFHRYIDAFEVAFQLAFTSKVSKIEVLEEVIDKVILPFWRYRSRLYEIWALVMTMNQFPKEAHLNLSLVRRDDIIDAYEWKIPKDKASNAVGVFHLNGKNLEVWFERETKNIAGNGYIKPDVRIMTPKGNDIFILELKDRYKYSVEDALDVLRKYSTGSYAKSISLVNYSPFEDNNLVGNQMVLNEGDKVLYVVNEFKPGKLDEDVISTIKKLINEFFQSYDLILDVSGSIEGIDINSQIKFITEKKGTPRQVYSFSDKLNHINPDFSNSYDLKISGNTDVGRIFDEYLILEINNSISEIIILTDEDGIEQFTQYSLTKSFPDIRVSVFRYGKNEDPVSVISI